MELTDHCFDGASAMQLLLHPLANEGSLINTARCHDLSDHGPFVGAQRNRHAVARPHKDGLGDLGELVIERRDLVGVPEVS